MGRLLQFKPATERADPSCREHFFYFPKKADAEQAAIRLRARGWMAKVHHGPSAASWLTFAQQPNPDDDEMEHLYFELQAFAEQWNGEYDGYGSWC
jgi:hypothetical protein